MKKYQVLVPATVLVSISVKAESEEAAIDRVLEQELDLRLAIVGNAQNEHDAHIVEYDFHRRVVEGNCYNGVANEAEAIELNEV